MLFSELPAVCRYFCLLRELISALTVVAAHCRYHDWTLPRLNEAGILAEGGAFVVVSPAEPERNARAVISRYGVTGSQRTNTTDTDPFAWKLFVRVNQ